MLSIKNLIPTHHYHAYQTSDMTERQD